MASILADDYGKLDHRSLQVGWLALWSACSGYEPANFALAPLAVKFDYERRDVQALESYQEAAALPGFSSVSPLLQARIYAGLAGTHAYVERTQEALSFLGPRSRDLASQRSGRSIILFCVYRREYTCPVEWANAQAHRPLR